MSLATGFLDALHADPTDRLTYGVFADWLEEQGDPRAALVRSLLELRDVLPHDAGQALNYVTNRLAGPVRGRFSRLFGVGTVTIDPRGLLRLRPHGIPGPAVPLRPEDWGWVTELLVGRLSVLRAMPELRDRLKLVPRLTLRPVAGNFQRWATVLHGLSLDRFNVRLEVQGEFWSNQHTALLAGCLGTGGLCELSLVNSYMGDAGLGQLLDLPNLQNLRHLDLDGNSITVRGVERLLQASGLRGLESLSLRDNPLDHAAIDALVQARPWPHLRRLCIHGLYDGTSGLASWLLHGTDGLRELDTPRFQARIHNDGKGRSIRVHSNGFVPVANLRELAEVARQRPLLDLQVGGFLAPESYAFALDSPLAMNVARLRLGSSGHRLAFTPLLEQQRTTDGVQLRLGTAYIRLLEALRTSPARQDWTAIRLENLPFERVPYLESLLFYCPRLRRLELTGTGLTPEHPVLAPLHSRLAHFSIEEAPPTKDSKM